MIPELELADAVDDELADGVDELVDAASAGATLAAKARKMMVFILKRPI